MILVDRRIGSKDLLAPLRATGIETELVELEFADIAFSGKGARGASVDIGIELKKLNDLVGSLRSGRLAGHQLPGLRAQYDHTWLIVEGQWQADEQGLVTTYQGQGRGWRPLPGKMRASELEKTLLTLELCGGLHVRYTNTRRDTVRCVADLFRWWTDQALDQHGSHLVVHQPPSLVPLTDFRKAVCQFPGIGVAFSKAVEVEFAGSFKRAVLADAETWAGITISDGEGRAKRLGSKTAQRILAFVQGAKGHD